MPFNIAQQLLCEFLVDQDVQTFIVSGEPESRLLWRGEGFALRRLERSKVFQHVELADVDHELFKHNARIIVSEIVTDHVVEHYAPIARDHYADAGS